MLKLDAADFPGTQGSGHMLKDDIFQVKEHSKEQPHPSPAGISGHRSHTPLFHMKSISLIRYLVHTDGAVWSHWAIALLKPLEVFESRGRIYMIGIRSSWAFRVLTIERVSCDRQGDGIVQAELRIVRDFGVLLSKTFACITKTVSQMRCQSLLCVCVCLSG